MDLAVGAVITFTLGGEFISGDMKPGKEFKMPEGLFSGISVFIVQEVTELEDERFSIKAKKVGGG